MGIPGIFREILADGGQGGIGGFLVEFIAEAGPVEAVYPEEPCIFGEGTEGEIVDKVGEIGLRSVIIFVPVVAQAPIVLHGVFLRESLRLDGQGFEKLAGLFELAPVEIVEGGSIFGIDVVAVEDHVELGPAGSCCGQDKCQEEYLFVNVHLIICFLTGIVRHRGRRGNRRLLQ